MNKKVLVFPACFIHIGQIIIAENAETVGALDLIFVQLKLKKKIH